MLCGVILGLLNYFIGVVLFCVLVNTSLVCFDLILFLVHCKFVLKLSGLGGDGRSGGGESGARLKQDIPSSVHFHTCLSDGMIDTKIIEMGN